MRSDEKKAILLIVKTAAQLKTDDINELNAVLGYAKESKLFTETVFGKRFIQRLEELPITSTNAFYAVIRLPVLYAIPVWNSCFRR